MDWRVVSFGRFLPVGDGLILRLLLFGKARKIGTQCPFSFRHVFPRHAGYGQNLSTNWSSSCQLGQRFWWDKHIFWQNNEEIWPPLSANLRLYPLPGELWSFWRIVKLYYFQLGLKILQKDRIRLGPLASPRCPPSFKDISDWLFFSLEPQLLCHVIIIINPLMRSCTKKGNLDY